MDEGGKYSIRYLFDGLQGRFLDWMEEEEQKSVPKTGQAHPDQKYQSMQKPSSKNDAVLREHRQHRNQVSKSKVTRVWRDGISIPHFCTASLPINFPGKTSRPYDSGKNWAHRRLPKICLSCP